MLCEHLVQHAAPTLVKDLTCAPCLPADEDECADMFCEFSIGAEFKEGAGVAPEQAVPCQVRQSPVAAVDHQAQVPVDAQPATSTMGSKPSGRLHAQCMIVNVEHCLSCIGSFKVRRPVCSHLQH